MNEQLTKEKRCRHSGTWILAGGTAEWCYHCGAYRSLERLTANSSTPDTRWVRPTGIGGPNPWPMKQLRPPKPLSPQQAAYYADADGDLEGYDGA